MKKVTEEIKRHITVPSICFYQHPKGGRGIYYMNGKVFYVHIDTELEQAEALKLTNHIHSYEVDKRGNVTMFTVRFENGRFIERACNWDEFSFSHDDIRQLAAHQEYKKTCESIGITGKVIGLYNKIKHAA